MGSHDRPGADLRAIHDRRPHPDEHPVVHQTGVKDSSVSATDFVPDRQGVAIRDVKDPIETFPTIVAFGAT